MNQNNSDYLSPTATITGFLVFDAQPDILVNGAEPTVVIGQPDFNTFEAGRSQSRIDGPDGLAYDYVNDRLFLSDHGSDRILLFDAHPGTSRQWAGGSARHRSTRLSIHGSSDPYGPMNFGTHAVLRSTVSINGSISHKVSRQIS